jgi:hypothetical protein
MLDYRILDERYQCGHTTDCKTVSFRSRPEDLKCLVIAVRPFGMFYQ